LSKEIKAPFPSVHHRLYELDLADTVIQLQMSSKQTPTSPHLDVIVRRPASGKWQGMSSHYHSANLVILLPFPWPLALSEANNDSEDGSGINIFFPFTLSFLDLFVLQVPCRTGYLCHFPFVTRIRSYLGAAREIHRMLFRVIIFISLPSYRWPNTTVSSTSFPSAFRLATLSSQLHEDLSSQIPIVLLSPFV